MSDSPKSTLSSEFDDHAHALGTVCIRWSHLEMFLDLLFHNLSGIEDNEIFETIAHNMDIREKFQTIIGLGFVKRPNEKWFVILKWVIDQIDNDLRVRRNRFIHDRWGIWPEGIIKVQPKTGLLKPQAFKLEYYTKIKTLVPASEVWQLAHDIFQMFMRTITLLFTLGNSQLLSRIEVLLAEHAPLPPDLKLPDEPNPEGDASTVP